VRLDKGMVRIFTQNGFYSPKKIAAQNFKALEISGGGDYI